MDAYETATRIVTEALRSHFGLTEDWVLDTEKTFGAFDADDLDIVEIEMIIEGMGTEQGMHFHLDTEMYTCNTVQDLIDQTAKKVMANSDPLEACNAKIDAIEEHMKLVRDYLRVIKNGDKTEESERWLRTTVEVLDDTTTAINQIVAPGVPA